MEYLRSRLSDIRFLFDKKGRGSRSPSVIFCDGDPNACKRRESVNPYRVVVASTPGHGKRQSHSGVNHFHRCLLNGDPGTAIND